MKLPGTSKKIVKTIVYKSWFDNKKTFKDSYLYKYINQITYFTYHTDWACKILTEPKYDRETKEWSYKLEKIATNYVLFGIKIFKINTKRLDK